MTRANSQEMLGIATQLVEAYTDRGFPGPVILTPGTISKAYVHDPSRKTEVAEWKTQIGFIDTFKSLGHEKYHHDNGHYPASYNAPSEVKARNYSDAIMVGLLGFHLPSVVMITVPIDKEPLYGVDSLGTQEEFFQYC